MCFKIDSFSASKGDLICLISLNACFIAQRSLLVVVHPYEHQRAPVDGLFELVDDLRVLLDGLVILGQLVGGDLEGALLRLTNLLLGFEIRLEIRLLTKRGDKLLLVPLKV